MRFSIFSFIMALSLASNIYTADIESKLTPEITKQIAKLFDSQDNGFEANIEGFKIKKIQDPTAEHQILLKEIESKIDADLEKQHYSTNGNYVILVRQTIENRNIYRVISFTVKENKNVENIKEIALIELIEAIVAERVHEASAAIERIHEDERVHEQVHALVHSVPVEDSSSISGLSAAVERVHQEEERAAIQNEHLHGDGVIPEQRIHEDERVHEQVHALVHSVPVEDSSSISGLSAPSLFEHINKLFDDNQDLRQERVHEHIHD